MNFMDMDSINDIIGGLSPDDIDALRTAAQSILGSSGGENNGSGKNTDSAAGTSPSLSPEMLAKITKIMSAMNKRDSRTDLIAALKPLLSEDKRKRADDAMQIIKLIDLLPLINEEL
ncbi:MAG: hypothetical protein K5756_05550 [Clostridiales bacterium]|nr:hypothetical protein [Clostridiales bacterium]